MEINADIMNRVENDSKLIDDVVDKVVKKYTGSLEEYVDSVKTFLENGVDELTVTDLNNMSLRIASYLFFLSSNLEKVGIRQAVSEQVRNEKYNYEYSNNAKGTIADKQSFAQEQVKEETLVNIIFDKSYKILKMRYAATDKLVDVIKKIISARLSEQQLTRKVDM